MKIINFISREYPFFMKIFFTCRFFKLSSEGKNIGNLSQIVLYKKSAPLFNEYIRPILASLFSLCTVVFLFPRFPPITL